MDDNGLGLTTEVNKSFGLGSVCEEDKLTMEGRGGPDLSTSNRTVEVPMLPARSVALTNTVGLVPSCSPFSVAAETVINTLPL
jgi:hypothetical protein